MFLEGEPNLRVDAAVVSRIAATKTSEAAGSRSRLSKQRRTQVADGIRKVRVVQNVIEVERERQIVATIAATRTTETTTAAAWSTTKTTTAAGTTRTTAAWAP